MTAGAFTTNLIKAAPVVLDMERLKQGRAQAILVNSGCANACTGEEGMAAAVETSRMVARQLDIPEEMVRVSSTRSDWCTPECKRVREHMRALVDGLEPDRFEDVARAIMTTDTTSKTVYRTAEIGGCEVNFMGIAKGSGMIMPNMATMLCLFSPMPVSALPSSTRP